MDTRHNCGWSLARTLQDAYSFNKSLGHRGREAAGIAAIGDNRIDVIKWAGPADRIDVTDLFKIFPGHNYHTFITHVRYATKGRKDQILLDAHPHVIGGKVYDKGSHIIITDCEAAIVVNGQTHEKYLDMSNCQTGCDSEALLHRFRELGEIGFLKNIPGSYSLAVADKRLKDVIVMRDRTGIKPGVLGWKDGKNVAASEDIAFLKNKAEYKSDLDPGSVYYFKSRGDCQPIEVIDPKTKYCFFEYNYVANEGSTLNGLSVRTVRSLLGEALAEEHNILEIDLVTFLPRCPEPAAISYVKKTKKEFEYVFYKPRNERAFQGSTSTERKHSISGNLHLIPGIEDLIKGKTLGVIDDSVVRGNNSIQAIKLLMEAGAKGAYLLSYTPPIGIIGTDGKPRGCNDGVDMPIDDDFIARNRSNEEIDKKMGIPVRYLSLEGMLKTFEKLGMNRNDLCHFCIGGDKPY